MHAVHVVGAVEAEEDVQHEQLSHAARQIEQLREQVGARQVVAARAAEVPGEAGGRTAVARPQEAVELHDDVPQGLVARLAVDRLLRGARRLHDRRQVDADAPVEEAPEEAGQEGAERLTEQDERHPLVVGDHPARLVRLRQSVLHRHVVGAAHPTDGVGVVDVRGGEVGRRPARDGGADVLLDADEDREDDDDAGRVLPVEPVDEVVVGADLEVAQLEDGANQLVHGSGRRLCVHGDSL